MLRIRGKGFPSYHSPDTNCGDLFINILVEMPKELTKEQEELIKKLKESIHES